MGIIRKKNGARGGEGGVKYVCDICAADVTSTVRIRCAHTVCTDYDLCVNCFAQGLFNKAHQPATHPFKVIEQNSVPIYDKNWGADEELLLLEGAEIYGLGSWADIADHIGGYRNKREVEDHYRKTYLDVPTFPLPEKASPHDTEYADSIPREEFQMRKKRRIEQRKEAAKNAAPAIPKTKPTASVPSCHEVQGYMPGRLEFETEYANEAEDAVKDMQFDPGDGINPRTGELDPEMELKMTVMDIYNTRLTQRAERKKTIFEHGLLEYRKLSALDKKRTKEERDLLMKAKPFARMMNHTDYEEFCNGLIEELNLRQAVAQLQDWRVHRIGDLKSGEKYEQDKVLRAQKAQPMGSLDRERYASSQRAKPAPVIETPSGAAAFVAPELVIRPAQSPNKDASRDKNLPEKVLTNGNANGAVPPSKQKFQIQPVSGVATLSLASENIPDKHLLTPEEVELCEKVRCSPKAYLIIKEIALREALKNGGILKKKQLRELVKMESGKLGRICDFLNAHGWSNR